MTASTAGLFIATPVPAYAETPCVQWQFNGTFRFRADFESGATITYEAPLGGRSVDGSFVGHPFDKPYLGEVRGTLNATTEGDAVNMTMDVTTGNRPHYALAGRVDDKGFVAGKGSGSEPFSWTSQSALQCIERAPVLTRPKDDPSGPTGGGTASKSDSPPEVSFDDSQSVVGILTVKVHDKSGIDTHCNFTATPRPPTLLSKREAEFDLGADDTYPIVLTASFKTGTTFDVVVDCGGLRRTATTYTY